MAKKESGITIRLTQEMANKFKTYAQNNNVSQGGFLEELLARYEKSSFGNNDNLTNINKETEISIFLCYENFFLEDECKQMREPKKYRFKGISIFGRNQTMLPVPAKMYEKALKNEFGITMDLDEYDFFYWVYVYKDCERNRFVVVETFVLKKKDSFRNKLNVNRCKFTFNLSEITQHISNFATAMDVKQIEFNLAETLTKDEEVESFLK